MKDVDKAVKALRLLKGTGDGRPSSAHRFRWLPAISLDIGMLKGLKTWSEYFAFVEQGLRKKVIRDHYDDADQLRLQSTLGSLLGALTSLKGKRHLSQATAAHIDRTLLLIDELATRVALASSHSALNMSLKTIQSSRSLTDRQKAKLKKEIEHLSANLEGQER